MFFRRAESRLAKAAGAQPSGQTRDEKLHAVVARSTFGSQNVPDTPFSDQFLEVEMPKKMHAVVARAHLEVKMYKTPYIRTALEVEMSKKCTPLWREKHLKFKMHKTREFRHTFGS